MIGAAMTSRAPLIGFSAASISLQTRSIVSRSGPKTLTPMSVRTPVESMSMRLMIGCVKMLLQPGTCSTRPISSSTRSPLGPVCRGQKKTLSCERLLQLLAQAARTARSAAVVVILAELRLHRCRRRSARPRAPCGAPAQEAAVLGAFDQFLQGVPGEGLGAAVEQFPVDLA